MDFFTLLIILVIVGRVIGAVMKAGQQGQPGQKPGTPPQRMPEAQHRPLPRTPAPRQTAPQQQSAENPAATMIPEELWEILTGQKRPVPPPPSTPAPKPATARRDFEEDEEAETADEELSVRRVRDERVEVEQVLRRHREGLEKRELPRPVPPIISLETEPLPEPARHAKFHEKAATVHERSAAAVVAPRINARFAESVRLGMVHPNDLKRAIILNEILGKPKALE
jgi:hypothetical protein